MKPASLRSFTAAAILLVTSAGVLAQRGQDFSQVQIKTTKIAGNVYALEGMGGTIGVLAGPDGVFMVDSQYAQLTDKIVAAGKQISDRPIRLLAHTPVRPAHHAGKGP